MLEERINKDLITAMKEKNKDVLNTLRAVKAAYKLELINKKIDSSEELLLTVISKEIKMRNDSITEFNNAGRDDLAKSYSKEVDILNKYMPSKLTHDELLKIIDDVFEEVKPESNKDLGRVMKELSPKIKNRCDMGEVNSIIKDKLN